MTQIIVDPRVRNGQQSLNPTCTLDLSVHFCMPQAEYGSYPVMVDPEYRRKVLKPLNDRFCLAEACLLADVVQHLQSEAGVNGFHPR